MIDEQKFIKFMIQFDKKVHDMAKDVEDLKKRVEKLEGNQT